MLTLEDNNKINLRYVYFSIIGVLFVIKYYERTFFKYSKIKYKKMTQPFKYFYSKNFVNIVKRLKSKSQYHFIS